MSNYGPIMGIVFLVFLAFVPAEIAQAKGRPFWFWYFLGLFLVLPALIAALVIKNTKTAREATETELECRDCPFCVQIIPSGTTICPYCDRDLRPPAPEPIGGWSPDADEVADRAWREVEA